MNFVMNTLWKWQARRRKESDELVLRYPAIYLLGQLGDSSDFDYLLTLIDDSKTDIRNLAMAALKEIINRYRNEPDTFRYMVQNLVDIFHNSETLTRRINVIEVMKILPISKREELFAPLLLSSANDLQYQIIHSLAETENIDILDNVLVASDTTDLVLKRKALETWYIGLENQNFDKILTYATKNLHYLIRANFELQLDGKFLNKILSYANKKDLPHPKAYPDFIIRYLNELLGKWDYDPESNRSLHAIVVPSYFTFDSEGSEEKTYVIL